MISQFSLILALIILESAEGRFIEKSLKSIREPSYIGKFGGSEVKLTISLQIASGSDPSEIYQRKLQLMAFSDQSYYSCQDLDSSLYNTEVYVPAYGSWSHDQKHTIKLPSMAYFYVADCGKELKEETLLAIKLDFTDVYYEHLSIENYGFMKFCMLSEFFYMGIILFIVLEIFKEKHDLAPLIILLVITIGFVISILFEILYAAIYEINGNSFKFLLVFAEIFKAFSEVSMIGIIILINAQKFNPKDFGIEEKEFYWYALFMFIEGAFGIFSAFISDPMEKFVQIKRLDGKIAIIFKILYLFIIFKYNENEKLKNTNTIDIKFRKIRFVALIFVLKVFILSLLSIVFPIYSQESLLFFCENLLNFFTIFYFLLKFCSLETFYFLPLKSHRY